VNTVIEQIPQMGDITLTIQISAQFNYSAVVAKRMVSRFVADEISYLLRAQDPSLVAAERIVWRVPVVLAFPDRGIQGEAGTVDVDVENGRLLLTPEQIESIRNRALEIATHNASTSTSLQAT
jgi:hypothetical protein